MEGGGAGRLAGWKWAPLSGGGCLLTRSPACAELSLKAASPNNLHLQHASPVAQAELNVAQVGRDERLTRGHLTKAEPFDETNPRVWTGAGEAALVWLDLIWV